MEATHEVRLSSGTIRYRDAGPAPAAAAGAPVVVFVHGLLVNGLLWRDVVERVRPWARCVVPDLPLGSHSIPMDEDADLSPRGLARLVGELLEALDLRDVVLVANDTGGAITQLLLAHGPTDRIGRVVLTPCDAFENFPPPMFRPLVKAARGPRSVQAIMRPMRRAAMRRAPFAFGWLTNDPVPDDLAEAWVEPVLRDKAVARDAARVLRQIDPAETLDAAARLHAFDRPVLIAWAAEDRFFPREHGERLAAIFPDARLEVIEGSRTFAPLDGPDRVAELLADFAGAGAGAGAGQAASGSQSAG